MLGSEFRRLSTINDVLLKCVLAAASLLKADQQLEVLIRSFAVHTLLYVLLYLSHLDAYSSFDLDNI